MNTATTTETTPANPEISELVIPDGCVSVADIRKHLMTAETRCYVEAVIVKDADPMLVKVTKREVWEQIFKNKDEQFFRGRIDDEGDLILGY